MLRTAIGGRICCLALCALAWLAASSRWVRADPVSDFYRHKTLSLIIGFPPGGGYDTNARVLAQHLGKFIPRHPSVVPSNMPGAGSMTAANHIFNDQTQRRVRHS